MQYESDYLLTHTLAMKKISRKKEMTHKVLFNKPFYFYRRRHRHHHLLQLPSKPKEKLKVVLGKVESSTWKS